MKKFKTGATAGLCSLIDETVGGSWIFEWHLSAVLLQHNEKSESPSQMKLQTVKSETQSSADTRSTRRLVSFLPLLLLFEDLYYRDYAVTC